MTDYGIRNQYPTAEFYNLIRDAAVEVRTRVQAPEALIGSSFMTAMSVACQRLVDVKLPTGQIRPVSLNLLTIAESGERKTATDSLVCGPIYEHDFQQSRIYQKCMASYEEELSYWSLVDKVLQGNVARAVRSGGSLAVHREQLIAHGACKPKKPRHNRIVYQSVTERPFMNALNGDGRSLAVMSDEGELILKGGGYGQARGIKQSLGRCSDDFLRQSRR